MTKPTYCTCENKDADQLCSNCEAEQCLCFGYTDSAIPLLSQTKFSSFQPSSELVQYSLCRTCLKTILLRFLMTWLISCWINRCKVIKSKNHVLNTIRANYMKYMMITNAERLGALFLNHSIISLLCLVWV